MWRLIEREDKRVLREGFNTENEAIEMMNKYEEGDQTLGVFTDGFYDIEEYNQK